LTESRIGIPGITLLRISSIIPGYGSMPEPRFLLATCGYGHPRFQFISLNPWFPQKVAKRIISSASLLKIWGTTSFPFSAGRPSSSSFRGESLLFNGKVVKNGVNSLSVPWKCFVNTLRKVIPVIPWNGARYIRTGLAKGVRVWVLEVRAMPRDEVTNYFQSGNISMSPCLQVPLSLFLGFSHQFTISSSNRGILSAYPCFWLQSFFSFRLSGYSCYQGFRNMWQTF